MICGRPFTVFIFHASLADDPYHFSRYGRLLSRRNDRDRERREEDQKKKKEDEERRLEEDRIRRR